MGSTYSVDIPDKRMIHALERMEWDSVTFHHAAQNSMEFKTDELFIPEIFHLLFLERGGLQVTDTKESETVNKGGLLEL